MNGPTRVLLLVQNNAYPADFRVRREALALHEAGCVVSVIAPRGEGQRWSEDVAGVRVYRFPPPIGGRGLIGYALEFGYSTLAMLLLSAWVAARRGVDVVHAANPPDTLFVIGAAYKLLGRKFVFDQHDLSPEIYQSRFAQPRQNLVWKTLRLLERLSYATADVVIVTNESYRKVAIERGGVNPESIYTVRNGPPRSYVPMDPHPRVAGRATHVIGYIGTIGPQDGLDCLLRAIACLVRMRGTSDFIVMVIGDGDSLPDVRRLAKDLDLERCMLFTGRLPEEEARACLSAATLCVQPDPLSPLNDKSTMNKVIEYMALRKPVVAFDLLETRVSAQDAAVYARPNDEEDFARLVNRLLDNPAERERMGEIGYQRVASALAWEFSVPHLLDAYRYGLGALAPIPAES